MKDKYNRELPPHLQWPPPLQKLSKFEQIFWGIGLVVGVLAFILWAFMLFQMPLNPAG